MPINYLILHGTGGSPDGNWFPWLKLELETQGAKVFCPRFPTPENHSLSSWLEIFEKIKNSIEGPTVLIGHSLGCAFALKLLEFNLVEAKTCVLVCPFLSKLGLELYDELNSSFIEGDFKWELIKERCENFYCFAGSNDPYVSSEASNFVASKLGASIEVIEGGGHLNAEFGYTEARFLDDLGFC